MPPLALKESWFRTALKRINGENAYQAPQSKATSSARPRRQRLPSSLVIESASEPNLPKLPSYVDRGASDER